MSCEERREMLLLLAAGALDPAEVRELREHLATGCAQCAGSLAEAEATIHQIPQSLPPLRAPDSAWESLESRMALREQMEAPERVERHTLAQPVTTRRRRSGNPKLVWLGWAIAAGVAIAIGWPLIDANEQIDKDQRIIKALELGTQATDALKKHVDELTREVDLLKEARKSDERMFADQIQTKQEQIDGMLRAETYAVGGPGADIEQPEVKGRLFWDKTGHRWILFASNVKALPPGKSYELWIITDNGRKIGTVVGQPDSNGNLLMDAQLPLDAGTLAVAAVTDEPGFVTVPTGKVQFAGSVVKAQ